MEYVEGETLAQLLCRRGDDAAAWADARHSFDMADAFAGVAEGLHHAHAKGVIHRDI
jgi:serine/threonine protein kinase